MKLSPVEAISREALAYAEARGLGEKCQIGSVRRSCLETMASKILDILILLE